MNSTTSVNTTICVQPYALLAGMRLGILHFVKLQKFNNTLQQYAKNELNAFKESLVDQIDQLALKFWEYRNEGLQINSKALSSYEIKIDNEDRFVDLKNISLVANNFKNLIKVSKHPTNVLLAETESLTENIINRVDLLSNAFSLNIPMSSTNEIISANPSFQYINNRLNLIFSPNSNFLNAENNANTTTSFSNVVNNNINTSNSNQNLNRPLSNNTSNTRNTHHNSLRNIITDMDSDSGLGSDSDHSEASEQSRMPQIKTIFGNPLLNTPIINESNTDNSAFAANADNNNNNNNDTNTNAINVTTNNNNQRKRALDNSNTLQGINHNPPVQDANEMNDSDSDSESDADHSKTSEQSKKRVRTHNSPQSTQGPENTENTNLTPSNRVLNRSLGSLLKKNQAKIKEGYGAV